ncbi:MULTISPECIES: rhomboid family intramembrane serine protease [Rhodobacterales]|uniref:rhomboid family intramembrane serine protease n=1 Tax=Rhodobacterales TaxID=204455 RepID=UPI00215D7F73|nr:MULTISPECIES: rhomboid family intramembrane serine protease [Rhodobacterales]MDO6588717.1 rhomboid family intramembrane serine protease [Yoonia sp. 1_MG-2023]
MMKPESPINAIPPIIIALALAIIGVEAVLQLADAGIVGGQRGVGWRLDAIQTYGFSSAVLDRVMINNDYSASLLARFVTYPFINTGLTQVAFCAALTLALGKFTAEFYGGAKILLLYGVTAIVGAVAFGLIAPNNYRLIGGFPPVYGLIGAYTYALWLNLKAMGENQLKAFRLIAVLLGLQLVFGLIFDTGYGWVAELTAFVVGFALSLLLAPGGWAAFLRRMRQRS